VNTLLWALELNPDATLDFDPVFANHVGMGKPRAIMSFDWAIKTVLRDKANFDVLEGFLSALLKERITVLELLESESNRPSEDLKANRVDLMVRDSRGCHVIVEIQYTPETDFLRRLLYGTSKVIVENLKVGETYGAVKKVISISIVYFDVGKGDDYVYHGTTEFHGIHTRHLLKVREGAEPYLAGQPPASALDEDVFPEYYLIPLKSFADRVEDDLDEWLYAFKHTEVLDEFSSYRIDALKEKLATLTMDEDERKRYEAHMHGKAWTNDVLTRARTDGRMEGLAEGRAEGRAERDDELRARLTARGMSPDEIDGILR